MKAQQSSPADAGEPPRLFSVAFSPARLHCAVGDGTRAGMTVMLTMEKLASLNRVAPWYSFGGLVFAAYGLLSHPFVTLAGFMALGLGAGALAFGSVGPRRAVWPLSGLLWIILLFMYTGLTYVHVADL